MIIPLNTYDFLEHAARVRGNQVAIVDGSKKFSYTQFLERANALNFSIHATGLKTGDVVSIIDYNSHHMLESYFGLLKTGLVINPINYRYSAEDILFMINYASSNAVFVHSDFLPLLRKIKPQLKTVDQVIVIEDNGGVEEDLEFRNFESLLQGYREEEKAPLRGSFDENDVAEVLFTSGSTSRPKAVALTHRNLYLNALYTTIAYKLGDDETLMHVVPLFHANGGGTPQIITALGGKHVMIRKVEPETMLELIQEESVTMFVAVPTVINKFLFCPDFDSYDTSSLRRIIVVGTVASKELMETFERKIPKCECLSAYGMTETGPLVALARPKPEEVQTLSQEEVVNLKTRTGYQILGSQIKIDSKAQSERSSEIEGEILVRGNSVFNEYFKDPDASQKAISDGWFKTGDWGKQLPGGWIVLVDRVKDMVKSGGENISSVEVEQVLAAHPDIEEVALIAVPDKVWGEIPVAIIVPKAGAQISEVELRNLCRERLAHFKVPKYFEFRRDLPRTVTGKIAKAQLRSKYWQNTDRKIN